MVSMSIHCVKGPDSESLIRLFAENFREDYSTELRGGASEPLYTPATESSPALIHFRNDYASSALHEVAHWCIAGAVRRSKADYGYWYEADGRNASQQCRFQEVEAAPQALEWCFSQACGQMFRLSLDNLQSAPSRSELDSFASQVLRAARTYQSVGLPPRGKRFFFALSERFGAGKAIESLRFERDALL